jgi:hypothetical protein
MTMTEPTYRDLADENNALRQELAEARDEIAYWTAADNARVVTALTAERDELQSVNDQMARLNDSATAVNLMVQRDEALRQRDEARAARNRYAEVAAKVRDLVDAEHELSGADVDSGEWKTAELERDHAWDALIADVEALGVSPTPPARPTITVLCGSTRFYDAFQRANYELTMQGHIVLSVGFYPHSPDVHGEGVGCTPEQKEALDELHKRKIDLADEVLVLNLDGYIGESTRGEIDYAEKLGKPVRYLVDA